MKLLQVTLLLIAAAAMIGCGSSAPPEVITELTPEQEAAIQAEMEAIEEDEAAQRRPSK